MSKRLVLGTVQFGLDYGIANQAGKMGGNQGRALLNIAAAAGVSRLDTAIAYGDSEQVLGELGTASFQIISKLPAAPADCSDITTWVVQQVQGSLRRLKKEYLDALLLHCPEQLLTPQGRALSRALEMVVKAGLVRKTGVSIYSPAPLANLLDAAPVHIVQAPFNVFDQRLLRSGWLQRLHTAGIEVHTRSCFLQGLLLMPAQQVPPYFTPWSAKLNNWRVWLAAQPNQSSIHACLSVPLQHPAIDAVVIGVDGPQQLRDILCTLKTPLAPPPISLACDDLALIEPSQWRLR